MARLKKQGDNKIKTENRTSGIGEKLRKAREEKGVSLEEVRGATKIHLKVLKAIEEDRLENILGQVYAKAFMKDYAHYMGIDAKDLVCKHASKYAVEPSREHVLEQKPFSQKERKNFSRAVIMAAAFLICFFILGFTARKFIHYCGTAVKNREAVTAKKAALNKEVEKKDSEEIKKLIPIPKRGAITLTLSVSRDSWMKVVLDGEAAFHKVLSKNSKETWKAKKEIILTEIGKPERLELNVNGKNIDLSGKRLGKNILITRKGINLDPK
ncbi:MAG: DUF4115 domain-containing protein [Candidatus Omnitrophota bacterium]|nr:DUF4115 domain-containing protein [Candidatus Omnitrophota bacterium]